MDTFVSMSKSAGGANTVIQPFEVVDVGIICSQSNLSNRNPVEELPNYISVPEPAVRVFTGYSFESWNTTNTGDGATGWSGNIVACKKLADFTGGDIHIIQQSKGGTGFFPRSTEDAPKGDWDINSIGNEDHFWKVKRKIANVNEWGSRNNKVIRWRWMWTDIGESDSRGNDSLAAYDANYRAFLGEIRVLTKNPNLPVFFKRLALFQAASIVEPNFSDFRAIQENLAATINNCYMINADAYTGQDNSHMDSAGSEMFGTDAYNVIVNNIL